MTRKQLIECIIDNDGVDMSDDCPPDSETVKCDDEGSDECEDCWADFLRSRYKNYKG